MIAVQRSVRSRRIGRLAAVMARPSPASRAVGRMIQIALAVYLLPVFLVVLAVGCLGMVVLAGRRLLSGPIRASLK
jgi:hypothetical protein